VELSDWQMWWKRRGGAGVRHLLMSEWDPIGVQGVPEAVDEYDAYVGVVGRMLREGATADAIATYLSSVCSDRMGLGPVEERDAQVAVHLREWYLQEMREAGDE
jgi:hypothetical protein